MLRNVCQSWARFSLDRLLHFPAISTYGLCINNCKFPAANMMHIHIANTMYRSAVQIFVGKIHVISAFSSQSKQFLALVSNFFLTTPSYCFQASGGTISALKQLSREESPSVELFRSSLNMNLCDIV